MDAHISSPTLLLGDGTSLYSRTKTASMLANCSRLSVQEVRRSHLISLRSSQRCSSFMQLNDFSTKCNITGLDFVPWVRIFGKKSTIKQDRTQQIQRGKPFYYVDDFSLDMAKLHFFVLGSSIMFLFGGFSFLKPACARAVAENAPASVSTQDVEVTKESDDSLAAEQKIADTEASSDKGSRLGERAVENFLKERLRQNPDDVRAHHALLRIYLQRGEVKPAIFVLNKIVELEPDKLDYRYMRASAYNLTGDTRKAREEFEELLKFDPWSVRALQGLAVAFQKNGEDVTKVMEMVEVAAKDAAENNDNETARGLRMLRGQILTLKGDVDEALNEYVELSNEDPNDFRPYLCQGLAYNMLGKTDKAEEYFTRFKKLCPKDFPNREHLDELLSRIKDAAFEESRSKTRSEKGMKQPSFLDVPLKN